MIPKIVHYCWFGDQEYNPLIKACMETWKAHLTDWEFILWNENNSPLNNKFVQEALKSKKYAFVADYVRCHALYEYGGVYLDTDMEVVKDLSSLLDCNFFAGFEDKQNQWVSCGVIGTIPENEIIKRLLEHYSSKNFDFEPIPKVLTKILCNFDDENIILLDSNVFYPYNPFDSTQKVKQLMYKNITNETLAIHHWNYSWKPSLIERILSFVKKKIK